MQPQLTPEQALLLLSQFAAAAFARGAVQLGDLKAAVVATEILLDTITPKPVSSDTPPTPAPEAQQKPKRSRKKPPTPGE